MSDPIHNPSHYTAYPVQPIEIARHLGFCMGNVFKYVMREPFKNGAEDLRKALKYLEWESEQHETTRFQHSLDKQAFSDFFDSVGYVPGDPESNIAFSVRTDVIPEPYALDIVNFLHEMFMYLFVREDYPRSGLIGMESDICNIIDTMENRSPGHAFRARNPVREKAVEAVRKNTLNTAKEHLMHGLGKQAKDKVTGFEGIIVAKLSYLFGCDQYGISPAAKDGKVNDTCYFDIGRVEITGDGVSPEAVQAEQPGGVNRDAPGNRV